MDEKSINAIIENAREQLTKQLSLDQLDDVLAVVKKSLTEALICEDILTRWNEKMYTDKYGTHHTQIILRGLDQLKKDATPALILEGHVSTDKLSTLRDSPFIAETQGRYFGFTQIEMLSSFAHRQPHAVYQIVFPDNPQMMMFRYTGEDKDSLTVELQKRYPNAKICYTYGDVVINNGGDNLFNNNDDVCIEYGDMIEELEKTKPELVADCAQKPLKYIKEIGARIIRSQISPHEQYRDIRDVIINLNLTINNAGRDMFNGGENHVENNEGVPTHEQIHQAWIEANPVHKGEYSQQYYDRLKQSVVNPVGISKHTRILRDIGYVQSKTGNGSRKWVLPQLFHTL